MNRLKHFQWRIINVSGFIKNTFNCVSKMNKSLTSLERHEGDYDRFFSFGGIILLIQLGGQYVTFRFSVGHTSSCHANSSELPKLSKTTECKTSSLELVCLLHLCVWKEVYGMKRVMSPPLKSQQSIILKSSLYTVAVYECLRIPVSVSDEHQVFMP